MRLKRFILAAVLGGLGGAIFSVGHYVGYTNQVPTQCTIPEAKTVAFLEGELSKCFQQEDEARYQFGQCKTLVEGMTATLINTELCQDRNLWFRRAHQAVGIPFHESDLIPCEP